MRHTFCGKFLIKEQTQPTVNLVLGKELSLRERKKQSGGGFSRNPFPLLPAQSLTHHLQAPLAPGTLFGSLSSDLELKVHQAGWRPGNKPAAAMETGPHAMSVRFQLSLNNGCPHHPEKVDCEETITDSPEVPSSGGWGSVATGQMPESLPGSLDSKTGALGGADSVSWSEPVFGILFSLPRLSWAL